MKVCQIRQDCGVKRVKNGANAEDADCDLTDQGLIQYRQREEEGRKRTG